MSVRAVTAKVALIRTVRTEKCVPGGVRVPVAAVTATPLPQGSSCTPEISASATTRDVPSTSASHVGERTGEHVPVTGPVTVRRITSTGSSAS